MFSLWCVDEYRLQLCSEGVIECLLPRDHTPVEGLLVLRHSRSGSYQMWTAGISLFWWRIYTLAGLEKTKCNYSSDHIGTRLMILCFLQSLSTFSTALECFDLCLKCVFSGRHEQPSWTFRSFLMLMAGYLSATTSSLLALHWISSPQTLQMFCISL